MTALAIFVIAAWFAEEFLSEDKYKDPNAKEKRNNRES